jgi:hypothetical protein
VQTVVETPAFLGDARSLGLSDAERLTIVTCARKVRFAGKGKGKSGGYRVITFFAGTNIPVFLLNIFAKNEKTDLTPRERRVFKNVLSDMVKTYRPTRKSR